MEDTTLLKQTPTKPNNSHLQGTQPTSAPLSVRDLAVAYHKSRCLAAYPSIFRKDSSSEFSDQMVQGNQH